MKKIIVFTGAGISAESGIKTFRDSGGLWEEYNIEDVATPQAWARNPKMVLNFYNQRRKQALEANPNEGHLAFKKLEKNFDVHIITQNIDNLHERAGSKKILHLHGEITKSRSSVYPHLIYQVKGWEIKWGERCEKGHQLRPHIVWFGEEVPEMENAIDLVSQADILIVAGTSLNVYPAASLINHAPRKIPKFLVDPNPNVFPNVENISVIAEKAGTGLPALVVKLMEEFG